MIPLYQALTFEQIIEKGGRNKPWVVSVDTPVGIEAYVVKLFSERDMQNQNALCKEVYGATFARELGLNTPDFCLVEFSDTFYSSLSPDLQETFNERHHRYAFGSKYLEGAPTYSASHHYSELSDYDIETIYAFDVAIMNVDRRIKKPNILFYDKEAYLIDHELSLTIPQNHIPEKLLEVFPYKKHIFHSVLRDRMNRAREKPTFDTFMEIFRRSRPDSIMDNAEILRQLGYDTDDSLVIESYLNRLRAERDKLLLRLKGSLQ